MFLISFHPDNVSKIIKSVWGPNFRRYDWEWTKSRKPFEQELDELENAPRTNEGCWKVDTDANNLIEEVLQLRLALLRLL